MTDPTRSRIFARHFVLLLDATKAAVEAGYSPNGAAQTAHKLLKRPVVQREIEKLRARQERRIERKLEHVLDELDNLAFARMSNYTELLAAEGPIEHLRTMDPEEAAAIESLSIDERTDERGQRHRRVKLKLHDKRGALTDLGRHLGMGTGRVQIEQVPPAQRPDISMFDARPCARSRRREDGSAPARAADRRQGGGG